MVDLILVLVEGIIYVEDSSSRITEHGVNALFFKALYNNFRT